MRPLELLGKSNVLDLQNRVLSQEQQKELEDKKIEDVLLKKVLKLVLHQGLQDKSKEQV